MGQKARRTIQVLMKKHHQVSVLMGEEYVGKAQKAKELKGVAGDKAEGHGTRQRERQSGKEASRETHESTARYEPRKGQGLGTRGSTDGCICEARHPTKRVTKL